eukprot:gnl/MRDRNA2_/MRDRNA2_27308_c0_seq1.p1 gnl/MRDRNA2_/MRDRNA2_27308_c0~~gnl/MRDRNA2_/MRDRNA2_27308_c0_seq1.p1  ORF type:complete len:107 (-),score=13.08 gnl/MRDRNA2_/MRDRNA2_27308_c0_seq1:300-620(-)
MEHYTARNSHLSQSSPIEQQEAYHCHLSGIFLESVLSVWQCNADDILLHRANPWQATHLEQDVGHTWLQWLAEIVQLLPSAPLNDTKWLICIAVSQRCLGIAARTA